MMEAFKAARLFNPGKVTGKPTAVTVDSLMAFPFFGIGGSRLRSELPTYLAAEDGILILFTIFLCSLLLLCSLMLTWVNEAIMLKIMPA